MVRDAVRYPKLHRLPGEKLQRPSAPALRRLAARSFFSRRSMVAGLIPASFAAIPGVMPKAGHDAMQAICCRSKGASIFPHLYRKNAQTLRRLPMTSSP